MADGQTEALNSALSGMGIAGQTTAAIIAPHGGNIERHTDEQAERVGERLASKGVSVWLCKGFKKDGSAFDRWHITSTDISAEHCRAQLGGTQP